MHDHLYVVGSDGEAVERITQCEAYTLEGERCSRGIVVSVDGLWLCAQHETIAKRPPRTDYWHYRKDPKAWREEKRQQPNLKGIY